MTDLAAWLLEQIAADEPSPLVGRVHGGREAQWVTKQRAECEAKRRIVTLCRFWIEHNPHLSPEFIAGSRELAEETLSALALPYADRPGYLEEWRP